MTLSTLLPMAAFALAASISPGPVNLVCLSSGTRYGLRTGLWFVTGATLGFQLLFLLIGLGLHAALSSLPGFSAVLHWAGIVFLLYLSYQLFREDGQVSECSDAAAPGFAYGALMQWLNPKAWLASAAGIGAYAGGGDLQLTLVFTLLYGPICWLSLSCWVLAGAYLRRYVQRPALMRLVNRGLALMLVVSCLFLLRDFL